MAVEFGTAKTVLILAIVVGCFAVLWPKLFYPMLQASVSPKNSADSQACCDVLFENDVNAIKVITELCGTILHQYDDFEPQLTQTFNQGKLTKEIVTTCRNEVLSKCGVDITSFLNEKVRLGHSYKQILDEIRSFNSSVCLKLNFGVNLGSLGAPRRMRLGELQTPKHYRQERPPHMRPELMHPALRERGRAIPQSHVVTRTVEKEPRPPIPGMRPPMGGPGHVVPAPKGSSTMGIIMPIYTIGIVIFFMYTILKVMFKKSSDTSNSYPEFTPDPEFRKMVFENYGEMHTTCDDVLRQRSKLESASTWKTKDDGTKLGDVEIDHLRKRLEETEAAMERIVAQMGSVSRPTSSASASASASGTGLGWAKEEKKIEKKIDTQPQSTKETTKPEAPVLANEAVGEEKERQAPGGAQEAKVSAAAARPGVGADPGAGAGPEVTGQRRPQQTPEPEDSGAKVKVMGMETTTSCEGGQRWSRPGTPVLLAGGGGGGSGAGSRCTTPVPLSATPEPQAIYLEGALPSQSRLLVSDSETQAVRADPGADEEAELPVILSGKMTLSLISLDAALAAEDAAAAAATAAGDAADDKRKSEGEEEAAADLAEEGAAGAAAGAAGGAEGAEEEDKGSDDKRDLHLVNDACHDYDDTLSATNYTTASAAAEATGTEETAADFSAMESIGPDDEQQDDLDAGEEVWNGDVLPGDEEDELLPPPPHHH